MGLKIMRSALASMSGTIAAAAMLVSVTGSGGADAAPERVEITIATGQVGGYYHPTGGALCHLVNENTAEHGISCTIEITQGSVANINDLRGGVADLALTQSDWHYNAVKGIPPFEEAGPFEDLRAVFALYVEHFTVVARRDKNIASFEDLQGKRVFLGGSGSGDRQTMGALMETFGWTPDDIEDVAEFNATNRAEALCDNEFDAFVFATGNPNPSVREAVVTCNAILVSIEGPIIEKLIAERPYFVASVIPADTYPGQSQEVPGFGLVATLVTKATTAPEIVYEITRVFFDNLEIFQQSSLAFSSLTPAEMTRVGLSAPLHDGAKRYFSQADLQ